MPKKGKKRKLGDSRNHGTDLYHLTGFSAGDARDDSLAGCLAEFDSATGSGVASIQTISKKSLYEEHDAHGNNHDDHRLWDPTISLSTRHGLDKEKATAWNANLQTWSRTGTYSAGLLPNFDIELSRHFQVEKLSCYLLRASPNKGEIKMPTFERWLIDSKLEERLAVGQKSGSRKKKTLKSGFNSSGSSRGIGDPVLPCEVSIESAASQRLVQELSEKLLSQQEASQVVQELCRKTIAAVHELVGLSRRCPPNHCPLKKGDRVDLEDRQDGDRTCVALLYRRKSWKKPYCVKLNKTHYNKLKCMFEMVHQVKLDDKSNKHGHNKMLHAFHLIVMTMMLRYSSLSGGQLLNDLRGGGMQGAVNPNVFSCLQRAFGEPVMECFASPFNSYFSSFGSAFADLDWHFGAIGDFFNLSLKEGCYEANPPFSPGFMMAMSNRMSTATAHADQKKRALRFVVIVPTIDETISHDVPLKSFCKPSFQQLVELSSQHIVLKAREHGYVEGAQHVRPTRFKESPYDTSVIVIQSQACKRVEGEELEKKIRRAFASRHKEELRQPKLDHS